MVFQAVTSHWAKAGRMRRERNYRMGDPAWVEYLQGFPAWWAPGLRGRARLEALADAIPPPYVYWLFANVLRYRPRRVLDLFAGVGGWLLGIALYADEPFYYEAVEKDRARCRALEASLRLLNRLHYYTIDYNVVCSDAAEYEPREGFDLVVGSPPCEDVTTLRHLAKGKLAGSYVLTLRYIEVVETVRPVLAVYENVPDGRLVNILQRAGFRAEVHDMSKVIPQTRRRLIAWRWWHGR